MLRPAARCRRSLSRLAPCKISLMMFPAFLKRGAKKAISLTGDCAPAQVKDRHHIAEVHQHKSSIWIPTPLQRFTSTSQGIATPLQRYPQHLHPIAEGGIHSIATPLQRYSQHLNPIAEEGIHSIATPLQREVFTASQPHCKGIHSISTTSTSHKSSISTTSTSPKSSISTTSTSPKSSISTTSTSHKSSISTTSTSHKSSISTTSTSHKSSISTTSTSHKSSIWIPTPLQREVSTRAPRRNTQAMHAAARKRTRDPYPPYPPN